jgi:hypothetical protein
MSARGSDFIPIKDLDFGLWVDIFFTYLIANRVRFNIPAEVVNELLLFKSNWNQKFAVAEAPETRTKAAIREKNLARDSLKKQIRRFVKEYVTFNHLVTDADRDNMGLPIYKTTRTPVQKPADIPEFWIDSSIIRWLKVFFRMQGSKTNAKPSGVRGAEIRWCILDHAPTSIDELIHSDFDTRTPFALEFDESDRGKCVYFCLRWENTKGEKGPWSEIMMAIIP